MYIINVHESCIRRTTYLHACSIIVNNTRYLYGYKYYTYVYRIEHRKIKCCSHISPDLTPLDVTIDINYDRHRATSRTTVTESAFPIFLVRNVKRDIRYS